MWLKEIDAGIRRTDSHYSEYERDEVEAFSRQDDPIVATVTRQWLRSPDRDLQRRLSVDALNTVAWSRSVNYFRQRQCPQRLHTNECWCECNTCAMSAATVYRLVRIKWKYINYRINRTCIYIKDLMNFITLSCSIIKQVQKCRRLEAFCSWKKKVDSIEHFVRVRLPVKDVERTASNPCRLRSCYSPVSKVSNGRHITGGHDITQNVWDCVVRLLVKGVERTASNTGHSRLCCSNTCEKVSNVRHPVMSYDADRLRLGCSIIWEGFRTHGAS